MFNLAEVTITAVASFAATNLDDIIILMIFFAQVNNSTFRHRHIIIGQYLGFCSIILASLPGFLGGLIIDKKWIGILGFVPIIIGIHRLISPPDENEIQAVSTELDSQPIKTSVMSIFTSIFSPQTYKVATITFANGGDNIGIYVPLFASSNLTNLGIILTIFFLMIAVWCCTAYQLTRHPTIAHLLTRYGHRLVPFVLIGLGIFILIDSETFHLFI
ncbi:cadmium resistance transporter [Calothrix sp. 336/3]|uniref:cadmium resistance transporter n=1 Tax=Calothrix sp. 336/3 TaxID=1337936 RepID=UPI0004E44902|nr:cadmium resistance transporter [Calothrix sp. 336/3]AKG20629.1 transporter [Calothrix sp. 336/3]